MNKLIFIILLFLFKILYCGELLYSSNYQRIFLNNSSEYNFTNKCNNYPDSFEQELNEKIKNFVECNPFKGKLYLTKYKPIKRRAFTSIELRVDIKSKT